jgi:hypothetical protein
VLPKPLLHRPSCCCTTIAVAAQPLPLLHRRCHHCATTFSVIAAPIPATPLLHRHNGDRRQRQWRQQGRQQLMTTATMKAMLTKMETMVTITMAMTTRPQQ